MSPVTEAKKRANKKWDAANMTNLSIKVRRDYAEEIRQACQAAGTTHVAVMSSAAALIVKQQREKEKTE